MKVILSFVVVTCALPVITPCELLLHASGETVDGSWTGRDWGDVHVKSTDMKSVFSGTYTDTYNGEPGNLKFEKIGERKYKGEWWESNKVRRGSFELEISKDSRRISISWKALDDDRTKPRSGESEWQRPKVK